MKTKRLAAGRYGAHHNGQFFLIEQYPDGMWLLFELPPGGNPQFWNDFPTLSAAKAAIQE